MDVPLGSAVGKYQVTELIGRGAMASVYRVRHVQLRAEYALKVLAVDHPEVCDRLVHEGRVQASLRHPNVVGVTDVIRIDGRPALVLEYVDGPDLEMFIRKRSPLPLADIDTIARGVLRGVRAAHRAGHLHRDLKPSNILLSWQDDQWVPKVADFGLAKVLHGKTQAIGATRSGQIMGSPPYMSPEQCRDSSSVDERSDVFSLGAVLYELATGQRAFAGADILAVMTRIASGAVVPAEQLRPDLPPRVLEALRGALITDRDRRIPDVDTLLAVWDGQARFTAAGNDVAGSVVSLLGEAADPRLSRVDSLVGRSSASLSAVPATVWGSMASLIAMFALAGGVLIGGGIVGLAVLAWPSARQPEPTRPVVPAPVATQPAPVPAPVPDVEPVPLDPEGNPDPAEPPIRTAPLQPAPTARPAPAPPPVPTAGRFTVEGDASVLLWNAERGPYNTWDSVPVGTYRVNALFHGDTRTVPLRDVSVEIGPDRTTVVRCSAIQRNCVVVGVL